MAKKRDVCDIIFLSMIQLFMILYFCKNSIRYVCLACTWPWNIIGFILPVSVLGAINNLKWIT